MHTVYRKLRDAYVLAALGCLAFALIYELFSHQVYSLYMIGAFLLPLLFGAVPSAVLGAAPTGALPGTASRYLYHSGLATLTAGCLFRGVLEIYGTTSRLNAVYWAVGTLLVIFAVGSYALERLVRELS